MLKRFLYPGHKYPGFYVKEEDGKYWLGHYTSKDLVHRVRISKKLYEALLKEVDANEKKGAAVCSSVQASGTFVRKE